MPWTNSTLKMEKQLSKITNKKFNRPKTVIQMLEFVPKNSPTFQPATNALVVERANISTSKPNFARNVTTTVNRKKHASLMLPDLAPTSRISTAPFLVDCVIYFKLDLSFIPTICTNNLSIFFIHYLENLIRSLSRAVSRHLHSINSFRYT